MKKTTSIHIKGIHFIIEEEAYVTLQNYMLRLEQKLAKTSGKEEIIEDIELRIAELFTQALVGSKVVIEQKEVDQTIQLLGEPEQYIDDEETKLGESDKDENNESYSSTDKSESSEKKLYRDTENASIAGVCAGLSVYFHIDIIVVRIIFILLALGGGFGFPLYIILWIVLPNANSHIDRLRMKGKPITVESVKNEVEMAATRLTNSSRNFEKHLNKDSAVYQSIQSIGKLFSKIAGVFLLLFGLSISIVFVMVFVLKSGAVPVTDENGMLTPYSFANLVLTPDQLTLFWWMGSIVLLTLIIQITATAMRLLLGVKYVWHKYLMRFTFAIGIIGTIACIYLATNVFREFNYGSNIKKEIATSNESFEINYHIFDQSKDANVQTRTLSELAIRKGFIYQEGYRVRLKESPDSLFRVTLLCSSNGKSSYEATTKAQRIQFEGKMKNHILSLPNYYKYPKKDKIRGQHIQLQIAIPKGKTIQFEGNYYGSQEDTKEIWIPSSHHESIDWQD